MADDRDDQQSSRRDGGGRGRQVRMGDIARMAGTSEATVSRALSGSSLVAEKTRKRILEIARSTGFKVNEYARRLATGHTRTIEVIFTIDTGTLQRVSEPFFIEMLAILADALADDGYDMLITRRMPWDQKDGSCAFLSGRAEGMIFIGQARDRSKIRDFARTHGHVVTWGAVDDYEDYCVIGTDNLRGGKLAADHLLSLGRKSFLFIGDPSFAEVRQRLEGFRLGLEGQGIDFSDERVVVSSFDFAAARNVANTMVKDFPDVDAIFAASDMIAMATMSALRGQGRRIPGDVAVVGFDDIPMAGFVEPSLTTIRQDLPEAGRLMMEKLKASFKGEPMPSAKLPAELIARASTLGGKS